MERAVVYVVVRECDIATVVREDVEGDCIILEVRWDTGFVCRIQKMSDVNVDHWGSMDLTRPLRQP